MSVGFFFIPLLIFLQSPSFLRWSAIMWNISAISVSVIIKGSVRWHEWFPFALTLRSADCDLSDKNFQIVYPVLVFRRYVRPISTTHDWPSKNQTQPLDHVITHPTKPTIRSQSNYQTNSIPIDLRLNRNKWIPKWKIQEWFYYTYSRLCNCMSAVQ